MIDRADVHTVSDLVAYLHQQAEIVTTLQTLTGALPELTPGLRTLLENTVRDTEVAVLPFVGPR